MKNITDSKTLDGLLDRLDRLEPDTPPLWGRMNAGQLVCHLYDVTRGVLDNAGRGSGRKSTLKHRIRKILGIYTPMPWPKGVPAPETVDAEKGGTPPEDFTRDRARAAHSLRELSAASAGEWPSFHPVFGKLSPREWGIWSYKHTDHHLRQFGL